MGTSGNSNFAATRNQIIRQSALDLGAISAHVTMSDSMLQDFAFRLNAMVKRWQAKGIHVWTIEEATLFPQPGQASYTVGPGAVDHVTQSYVKTALAASAVAGAMSLTVDDDAGILGNDFIGIVLDDGTIHWTNVNGAPVGNVVAIVSGLASAAAEDKYVYVYTTKINRPLGIPAARRFEVAAARDTPIMMIARLDYRSLPNKTNRGVFNQAFYDPRRDTGIISLWNAPADVSSLLNFTWYRAIQNFDVAADNPDLPQEWISVLITNLANEMKLQYGQSAKKSRELDIAAARALDDVSGLDREQESIFMQPDV